MNTNPNTSAKKGKKNMLPSCCQCNVKLDQRPHLVVGDGLPRGLVRGQVPLLGTGEVPGGEAPLQGQIGQEQGHFQGVLEGHLHYDGLCGRERDRVGQGEWTPYRFL